METSPEAMRALQEKAAQCDLLGTFSSMMEMVALNPQPNETEEILLLVENEFQHCGLHHHSPDPSARYGSVQWKKQIEKLKEKKDLLKRQLGVVEEPARVPSFSSATEPSPPIPPIPPGV